MSFPVTSCGWSSLDACFLSRESCRWAQSWHLPTLPISCFISEITQALLPSHAFSLFVEQTCDSPRDHLLLGDSKLCNPRFLQTKAWITGGAMAWWSISPIPVGGSVRKMGTCGLGAFSSEEQSPLAEVIWLSVDLPPKPCQTPGSPAMLTLPVQTPLQSSIPISKRSLIRWVWETCSLKKAKTKQNKTNGTSYCISWVIFEISQLV